MSMQQVWYIVGVAGVAIGLILGLATAVYSVRNDIRGVWDELSGRRRRRELDEYSFGRGRLRRRSDDGSPADVEKRVPVERSPKNRIGDDETTESERPQPPIDSSRGTVGIEDEEPTKKHRDGEDALSDDQTTQMSGKAGGAWSYDQDASMGADRDLERRIRSREGFVYTHRIIVVHSSSVIDRALNVVALLGIEVPCEGEVE